MRRRARALPTASPPRPQPPHPVPGPQRTPTRAPPTTQNTAPAPRAHQPARNEVRLQTSTIVCDDEQDRPSFRGIKGPPRHASPKTDEGAQRQHDDHHHVVGHPARQEPSPASVSLTAPAVTTQRVAQQRVPGTPTPEQSSSPSQAGSNQPCAVGHGSRARARLRRERQRSAPQASEPCGGGCASRACGRTGSSRCSPRRLSWPMLGGSF
jgi:hypothetical protein